MKAAIAIERILYRVMECGWQYRKLIIYPVLILPVFALIIGHISPKTYEMQTTVLFQEPSRINPFMEDLSIGTNLKDRMASLNALLHSRHMLVNVLTDLQIINEEDDPRMIAREVDYLSSMLSVELSGDDLVTISMRHNDPSTMNATLDAVARRFIEKVLTPAWTSLTSSQSFLEQELEKSKENLNNAENALAEFKSDHSQELPMLHASNVARLAKIQTDLSDKRSQLSGAKGAITSLESRLVQTNPVIGRLEEQIIHYSSELALLKSRYTEAHSKVKAVQRTLSRLQEERNRLMEVDISHLDSAIQHAANNNVWNITIDKDNARPLLVSQMEQMDAARVKVNMLTEEIAVLEETERQLQEKVHNFGAIERELIALERKADVHRELHANMLKRSEMARVTGDLSKFEVPSRVKIIDQPFKTPSRVTPPLLIFGIAGGVGGLLLGCAAAAMLSATDTTIKYPRQLTELIQAPILMQLPAQQEITLLGGMSAPKAGRIRRIIRRITLFITYIMGRISWFHQRMHRISYK